MKTSFKYTLGVLSLLVIGVAIYFNFNQPVQKTVLGNALVLAFVEQSALAPTTESNWLNLGLSIELVADCAKQEESAQKKCVVKYIDQAISRLASSSKALAVIAESSLSHAALEAINTNFSEQVSSLVLIKPQVNHAKNKNYKLPKTLIISEAEDLHETVTSQRRLASSIRQTGAWTWFTMLAAQGVKLIDHAILPHTVSYLLNDETTSPHKIEFEAESHWQHPQLNNQAFLQQEEFIETRGVDNDLQRILKAFFAYDLNLLKQWPIKTYKAFDILKYRKQLPPEKQGQYLSFSNRKGHTFYLDLNRYSRYKPEFVVAIDDEDNLYRLTSFYKTKQYYSWEEGGPDDSVLYAEPLGAFIHFQKPLPPSYELPYLQYSSIIFESIKFTDKNPYAELSNLSLPAYRTLTLNCIPCHSVDGVGGAAYHLNYLTLAPEPGLAQPLRAYSQAVLKNFFFNQTATARLIGVNPNYVEPSVGEELMEWLQIEN